MKSSSFLAPTAAAAMLVLIAALASRSFAPIGGLQSGRAARGAHSDAERQTELAELSDLDLDRLIEAARGSVERAWREGPPSAWSDYPYAEAERGLAVRLVSGREERGCLAFYRGVGDLEKAARIAALDAAFLDSRYRPVAESEAACLDIEVSVFGAFRPMRGPLDFIVGEDAVIMRHAEGQVLMQGSLARERGWDRRDFLEALCRKDGLEPGAWKDAGASFMKASCASLRRPFRAGPAAP